MSDRVEHTFVLLRYSLGGDRPSQTTQHTLSLNKSKLESQSYKGGISRATPPELASKLQSLPPILHI
jgi:hypothetical protein